MVAAVSRLGGTTAGTFDARGNVTSVADANGMTRSATYDELNRPTSMTDPATGTITYTYTGSNRIPTTTTDQDGNTTTAEIVDGLVTRTTDPDGVVTTMAYDADRRVREVAVAPGTPAAVTTTYTYDNAGRPLTVTDPAGGATSYAYDAGGRTTSVTDPLGHATTYTYDAAGRLLSTTDPTGATTAQAFDSSGRVASVTSPRGLTTSYGYDALGQLTTTTFPDGVSVASNTYLMLGRVATASDELGRTTSFDYDADGNVSAVTDATGATSSTSYDTGGRVTATVDPLDRTTSATTYDTAGRVATTTELGGATSTYGYDPLGRVTTVTDARGGVTKTTYTPGGRIKSVTDPAGVVTTSHYDAAGRLARETTPTGDVVHVYDAAGREIETISPGGLVTRRSFDAIGRLTSVTDSAGVVTTLTHTDRGELASETRGAAGAITYTYDPDGNLESVTDGRGNTTTFGYDDRNQRISRTDVNGRVTRWAYDEAGQLTSRTDPLGRTTTFGYDDAGRLVSSTDPSGRSTTRTYDEAGQATALNYGDGSGVTYTYDPAGRLATADDASGTTRYAYEPGGLPARIELPDGRVTSYRYDAAGRRVGMTLPDGSSYRYGYDPASRLATITPGETVADTFTGADGAPVDTSKWVPEISGGTASIDGNQLHLAVPPTAGAAISVRSAAANATNAEVSFRFRFADNAPRGVLRVRLRNHPNSYWVEVANNSITASLNKTVSGATTTLGTFTLDGASLERALRFRVEGDQLKVRIWDPTGAEPDGWNLRRTDTSITTAGSMRLTWSAASSSTTTRTLAVDDVVYRNLGAPPAPVATYDYDADGNITAEALPGGSRSWTWTNGQLTRLVQNLPGAARTSDLSYDTTGRLRWERTGSLSHTYSYDRSNQLRLVTPSSGDPTTYTYDGRGRRTSATTGTNTTTYTYDHAGQLTSATAGTSTTTYDYDPAGRRTSETGPDGTTTYDYDPAGRLATHGRDGTTQTRTYTHDDTLTALTTTTGATTQRTTLDWDATAGIAQLANLTTATGATNIIGGYHQPAAVRRGATTAPLAVDARGSVTATTGTADIARAGTYDAYGTPTGTPTFDARIGYRGELTLDTLTHLRARDYQPVTGAFTTVDPLEGVTGTPTIANPYHYADNDPLNKTDPTGLRPGMSAFGDDPLACVEAARALGGGPSTALVAPGRVARPIAIPPPPTITVPGPATTTAARAGSSGPLGWAAIGGAALGCAVVELNPGNYRSPIENAAGDLYDWITGQDDNDSPCAATPGTIGAYGKLPRNHKCDRHHIIQEAAVRDLAGYNKYRAPAIILTKWQHGQANLAQRRAPSRGTYGLERKVADDALFAAGMPLTTRSDALDAADRYFMRQLRLSSQSPLRIPWS